MKQVQVTLLDKKGKYRPVSCLISVPDEMNLKENKETLKERGIKKICLLRGWTKRELIQYNYLTCKIRFYDKNTTIKENKNK